MEMEKEKDLSVVLPEDTYCNLAIIAHSSSEFVLDFAAMLPGMKQPDVRSRIIMTPEHVKRFYFALQENISKFESQFGKVELEPIPGAQGPAFPMGGFGPNGAQS